MPLTDPAPVLALARDAALAAGGLLLGRFAGPASGVSTKASSADLVSDADRDAEALIVSMLRAARPGDAITAEEGGGTAGDGLAWLVDPLDGTVNFLFGIPHWAVSIACRDRDGTLAAVVHDPCRGETFTAVRDGGARLGHDRLRVPPGGDLATAMIGTGFSYDPAERARQGEVAGRLLGTLRDIRRGGSAALDLCWVACGRLDAFFESDLAPWDWAAGGLVVAEAGGELRPLPPGRGGHFGLVGGRPGLVDALWGLVTA